MVRPTTRHEGTPLTRPFRLAKFDKVPDAFATWESRMTRTLDRRPCLGFSVRGRFPVTAPTHLKIAASVFDVVPGADGQPSLSPVHSTEPESCESGSPAFHHEYDFGVVDPGKGFLQWVPTLTISPDDFLPPEAGQRHYRIRLVLYDTLQPPRFDHGALEGKVLWLGCHDLEERFDGTGYRTIERERIAADVATMELATLTADPHAAFPVTRRVLERWIEVISKEESPSDREELEGALDGVLDRVASGACDVPELIRVVLRADQESELDRDVYAPAVLELALDLLDERDAEMEVLLQLGDRLFVPRADVQAMIDCHLVRRLGCPTGEELGQLLGLDPRWDLTQTRAHLTSLFVHWSARTRLVEMRAEAEWMLDCIAEARVVLETERSTERRRQAIS